MFSCYTLLDMLIITTSIITNMQFSKQFITSLILHTGIGQRKKVDGVGSIITS